MKPIVIPKGGMCAVCVNKLNDCSKLNFKMMSIIKKESLFTIVRCDEFKQGSPSEKNN